MNNYQDLSTIHEKEVDIALFFKQFCEENNLNYTMLGGTFLGAIRHQGFIPWDDDMDFGMPRKDYNKFIELISKKNTSNYIFKNFRDSDIKTYFSRLEDQSIQLIDRSAEIEDVRHPWIDIFPLDNVKKNSGLSFKFYKYRLLYCRMMVQYSQFDKIVNLSLPNRPFPETILIAIGKLIKPQKFLNTKKRMEILDKVVRKYENVESNFIINFSGAYKFKEMFEKNIYTELKLYPFEDDYFLGPVESHLYLSQLYGDYMVPPKDAHKNKHGIYIDNNSLK